ncbi:MAG TPA: hypothetical protein EYP19_00860 [Desulfobacterales bacterium]|nr:hypothetical protein [Desulfobacterales bacterium]
MAVMIAEKIAEIVERIESGPNLQVKLQRLVEKEIRRRLAEYEYINRQFQQKYGMTLAEFEATHMLEKLGYSFEAESDYHDWDQAVDGIAMLRRELRFLSEAGS